MQSCQLIDSHIAIYTAFPFLTMIAIESDIPTTVAIGIMAIYSYCIASYVVYIASYS